MNDEEIKCEEIEVSRPLGTVGKGLCPGERDRQEMEMSQQSKYAEERCSSEAKR
jgi:hypothetical protein